MIQFIYHDKYNFKHIPFFPHPFDPHKYRKILDAIIKHKRYIKDILHEPHGPEDKNGLLLVHSPEYLKCLEKDKSYISKGIDFPYFLNALPMSSIDKYLLLPQRYAVAGTVLATNLAIKYGMTINLGGGFHHAKYNDKSGEIGGCFYADIPLAITKLKMVNTYYKIAVIDLDAHQGDGIEEYAKTESNVFIFDMFNKNEYPWDKTDVIQHAHTHVFLNGGHLEQKIKIPFLGWEYNTETVDPFMATECVVDRKVDDEEYLRILKTKLPEFLDKVRPDFIFYNAGSDIYEKDSWGCMNVSAEGIKERDEFVFTQAHDRGIPITMTLSGGYSPDIHKVISDSILNLMDRFN